MGRTHFTSWNINTRSKYVMQPANKDLNITFDNRGGYGHKVNNVITCFYKYTGFTGVDSTHKCCCTYDLNLRPLSCVDVL